MNILQLSPLIPVYTPLGKGLAYLVIDYGMSINTCWGVRLADGQFKHFDSNDIRLEGNPTYGYATVPDIPDDWIDSPKPEKDTIPLNKNKEAS